MTRTILLLLLAVLAAGCVDGRFQKKVFTSPDCGPVTGYTYTGILYGDSKLVVIPVSKITAGTEWRFYLKPIIRGADKDPDDYNEVTVSIKGKTPGDPPGANDWIATSGSFATAGTGRARYITECVPEDAAEGTTYYYLVEVDKVGTLDPRADVL